MIPSAAEKSRLLRWRLTVLLGLGAICYWALFAVYPHLLWSFGVHDYGPWFLDLFAVLASNDAVSRGFDPYVPNALDYFHRPHVYSHWWLHLRDLGLTRADVRWLALTLIGLFLVAALSRLRPREPRQLLFYLAVLCSSPVLLAVNRANNDLVIFILLTPLVPCLLDSRSSVRLVGLLLIAAAAALKYYPAVAGLLLLTSAPGRDLRWRVGLMAALLVAVGLDVLPNVSAFGGLAPHPDGLMTFGAMALFHSLGWDGLAPTLVTLALGAAAFGWFWRSRRFDGWTLRADQQADWLHFVLGSALLAGCFFASPNYAYRWIFALWLAPLLWTLPADATAPESVRRLARLTRGLLLGVLWIDAAYCMVLNRFIGSVPFPTLGLWADRLFIVEQPLVWAFFGCMLAFLAYFTRSGLRGLLAR